MIIGNITKNKLIIKENISIFSPLIATMKYNIGNKKSFFYIKIPNKNALNGKED